MALCDEGAALLVAFERGPAFYDLDAGPRSLERLAAFEPDVPRSRMNDGRVDRQGRFLVGGYNEDGWPSPPASGLYALDPATLQLRRVRRAGVSCANSIAFSPDGGTAYFTDSCWQPRTIVRVPTYGATSTLDGDWDFVVWPERDEAHSSSSHQPTTAATTNSSSGRQAGAGGGGGGGGGIPDGAAVDSEGGVWSAQFGRGRVARYDAEGRLTAVVRVPVPHVTCIALGGPELRTMYITTAAKKLSPEQAAALPPGYAGGLFRVELPRGMLPAGLPEQRFARSRARRLELRRTLVRRGFLAVWGGLAGLTAAAAVAAVAAAVGRGRV